MEGASTLFEAAKALRAYAKKMHIIGYELNGPIGDNYGHAFIKMKLEEGPADPNKNALGW